MGALVEITPLVRIYKFLAHVQFLVVDSLALECILDATLGVPHVKAILTPHQKIVFHHVPSVALSRTHSSRHNWMMASRSPALKLELTRTVRNIAPFMTSKYRHGKEGHYFPDELIPRPCGYSHSRPLHSA